MYRGYIHKIVADLLSAFAQTGFFYGWAHKQPPEFQILTIRTAMLSTKKRFQKYPPKPNSCALLKDVIDAATILRNDWVDGNARAEHLRQIDRQLRIVKQEYKILSAAKVLKRARSIID